MMLPPSTQRPYVEDAVGAARLALEIYRAKRERNLTMLAAFEKEFKRIETLSTRHAKGESTLSAVVYPARKLALQVSDASERADDAVSEG